jgi:eukaryotic-like serine/threonine-protein kinase
MDVGAMAPFTQVECPTCGKATRIKREFGPYTLVRRHAIGGMSMVFVARDNTLDREVAVKILSETYSANEKRIAAFEEEARMTASFSHPNVVRVLRTGRAFGRFYIAMELVPGGHFERQIEQRGKIPELEMLTLASQVAQGLKAAHATGLIHRDVKPGNILLDAEGNAKLVDFGLALVTQSGTARATEFWATPYYVPPETVEGAPEDFRSDIYAFGATLYHALAGSPPCCELTMATAVLREAKKKVVPLSLADPELSVETCQIVERAMAYHPKDRHPSYDALISQIEGSLKRLKSSAAWANETSGSAARRLARKKRSELITLIAAGGIMLTAVSVGTWWVSRVIPFSETPTPVAEVKIVPTPEVISNARMDIAKCYRDARAAVKVGDFSAAAIGFIALADLPEVQEPSRTWAGVEAAIILYLEGKSADARDRAVATATHAATVAETSRIDAGLLQVLAQQAQLTADSPVSGVSPSDDASQVTAAFLTGLKHWDQGRFNEAEASFTTATAVTATPDYAWVVIYQNLARNYLTDFKQLSSEIFKNLPEDAAGCKTATADLEKILTTLKTRGRAPTTVRARQVDLARHAMSLTTQPAAPSAEEITAAKAKFLAGSVAKIATLTQEYKFTEASAELKKIAADPATAEQTAKIAMTDHAATFLTDLETDLTKTPIVGDFLLKSGDSIRKISIGPDRQLIINGTDKSSRPSTWSDFSADSLIRLYRTRVKTPKSEPERLRRNECAIAFDWLVGNRERALNAADQLSQSSTAFKQRWQAIAPNLPK